MTTASGEGRKREVYRYDACRNRVRKTVTTCDHPRLSAPEVEKLVVGRVSQVCADADMRARIARRMSVTAPEIAARLRAEHAEVEARRVGLRTEADRLMKALGSGGGALLADRISEIERELEPIHGRLSAIDGQMRSLQFAAEQVTQTIAILEVFDRAWQAFTPAERHELILVLVERVVVNVVAGSVEIALHDISGPFDTDLGAEPVSGASVAAPAGPDELAPCEAPLPWLASRAAPSAAHEARPCVLAPKSSPSAPRPPSASRRCPTAAPGTTPRPTPAVAAASSPSATPRRWRSASRSPTTSPRRSRPASTTTRPTSPDSTASRARG